MDNHAKDRKVWEGFGERVKEAMCGAKHGKKKKKMKKSADEIEKEAGKGRVAKLLGLGILGGGAVTAASQPGAIKDLATAASDAISDPDKIPSLRRGAANIGAGVASTGEAVAGGGRALGNLAKRLGKGTASAAREGLEFARTSGKVGVTGTLLSDLGEWKSNYATGAVGSLLSGARATGEGLAEAGRSAGRAASGLAGRAAKGTKRLLRQGPAVISTAGKIKIDGGNVNFVTRGQWQGFLNKMTKD